MNEEKECTLVSSELIDTVKFGPNIANMMFWQVVAVPWQLPNTCTDILVAIW
jgi:hypothetical protein